MKCPYCNAQIAYMGEEHQCRYPELASGDPPHPDGFGGTDEDSHLMSSKQGLKGLNYGISPNKLLELGDVSIEEARELRDRLFKRYPQLKKTMQIETKEQFEEHTGNLEIDPDLSEAQPKTWVEALNRELSHLGTHALKTWPEYFQAVVQGDKTFEVRKHDRDYHVGDLLVLQEWDPKTREYTGRSTTLKVTYLMASDEFGFLNPNVVVMGFKRYVD